MKRIKFTWYKYIIHKENIMHKPSFNYSNAPVVYVNNEYGFVVTNTGMGNYRMMKGEYVLGERGINVHKKIAEKKSNPFEIWYESIVKKDIERLERIKYQIDELQSEAQTINEVHYVAILQKKGNAP